VKRFTKHWPWILLMVAALLLATACEVGGDTDASTCVEVDVDAPKAKKPKAAKPKPKIGR